jgi:hypothetical protein
MSLLWTLRKLRKSRERSLNKKKLSAEPKKPPMRPQSRTLRMSQTTTTMKVMLAVTATERNNNSYDS